MHFEQSLYDWAKILEMSENILSQLRILKQETASASQLGQYYRNAKSKGGEKLSTGPKTI